MNISHSMNELTRIDEIEWLKAVLVVDDWVKLWEAHPCFDTCCRLYWLLLVFEGDLYVDLSFISEWEVFLGWILIWIIDLGTLLFLDRCRECEITGDSFRMALSWKRLINNWTIGFMFYLCLPVYMIDLSTFESLFKFCLSLIICVDKISSLWFHYMLMY